MHHLDETVRNVGEALLVLSKIKKKFEKVEKTNQLKDHHLYHFLLFSIMLIC